jgi:hypothetical protein
MRESARGLSSTPAAFNALSGTGEGVAREIATMLYGDVHPSGHFRFVKFGHGLVVDQVFFATVAQSPILPDGISQ